MKLVFGFLVAAGAYYLMTKFEFSKDALLYVASGLAGLCAYSK